MPVRFGSESQKSKKMRKFPNIINATANDKTIICTMQFHNMVIFGQPPNQID